LARLRVPRLDSRAALLGGALAVIAALPAVAGFVGPAWELSQCAGLAAAIACILLCGAPLRPRNSEPATLLSLPLHTAIGYAALLLTALHVGGLLLADHTVLEYLKPTAPPYQLAGIAAALLLALAVFLSQGAVRRRLWKSHRDFQAWHVILACVLAVLIAVHVVVTARYVGGAGRRALYVAATSGALALLLRARRPPASSLGTARPLRVFGRHSALIVAAVAICIAALAALLPAQVDASLREPPIRRATRPALDFPHDKHGAVNCLTCHHNYADATGAALCVECHRSPRPDLRVGAEARFHGFCLDCHRHPSGSLQGKHGPVSGCRICHRPPGSGAPQSPSGGGDASGS
jgi:DMSO/TMAO reductase YedYZ heme-binding membrane subunit